MADITKCSSQFCPLKSRCYRQLACDERHYQSYSNFEYTCNENTGFQDFIATGHGEIFFRRKNNEN